jgi:hypothetical protein
VQRSIQTGCQRAVEAAREFGIGQGPERAKVIEARPQALGTRAVTGCQGCNFIEEKQLGVVTGPQQGSTAVLECQRTKDPTLAREVAPQRARSVMQAAAVSKPAATFSDGHDFAARGDTVP